MDGGDGIKDAFAPLVAVIPADLLDRFGGEPIADSGLDSLNGGGDTESHPWPPVMLLCEI